MKSLTVAEIARLCGATLDAIDEGTADRSIVGPATLAEAGPDHVSFLGNRRYLPELETTRAGAVLVMTDLERPRPDLSLLRCENPSRAFTRVIEAFRPAADDPAPGIHPSAVIEPEVELGRDVSIGAHCCVGAGSVLADGVVLHPGTVLGRGVRVGEGSVLHPSVVAYAGVEIGARCVVHAGVVLGSDGFGFEPTAEGWEKIPQCGTVVVEDDVEIGANTAIDRGRFGATRIGAGVKIDNLVHIAHNVVVGRGALLIAQVGIAGSSKVGSRAILAGQAGIAGHVEIGEGARVSAQSGVGHDLPPGTDWFGSPARPQAQALRSLAQLARLPELVRRVRELERRLAEKEEA